MDQPDPASALTILGWLEFIKRIGGFMVIAGVAIEVGGDWWATPYHKIVDDARELEIAKLSAETSSANVAATAAREQLALAEERLLSERRLTANERWRLSRLEMAILPRSIGSEQWRALVDELRGKAKNICVLMLDKPEPQLYAIMLMQLFTDAGIETTIFTLPRGSDQAGVSMWVVNDEGEQIADILWRVGRIGGGQFRHAKPIGLEMLPEDKNCLIVGENDAALRGAGGQPGEGIDMHGTPVPNPQ